MSGGIRAKNNQVLSEFYEVNVYLNTMMPRAPIPEPRFGHSAVCIQNFFVLCGGVRTFMHSIGMRSVPTGEKKCYALELGKTKWHELPEILHARIYPTLVTIANRYVYHIGGYEDFYFDCYVLDLDQWKLDTLAEMSW